MDVRSQIKVHTEERTQVHSAQYSRAVTHPSSNRARRCLTSVIASPSKHWSPLRTSRIFNSDRLICMPNNDVIEHLGMILHIKLGRCRCLTSVSITGFNSAVVAAVDITSLRCYFISSPCSLKTTYYWPLPRMTSAHRVLRYRSVVRRHGSDVVKYCEGGKVYSLMQ